MGNVKSLEKNWYAKELIILTSISMYAIFVHEKKSKAVIAIAVSKLRANLMNDLEEIKSWSATSDHVMRKSNSSACSCRS
jgi:L-rhamnose mutarotase